MCFCTIAILASSFWQCPAQMQSLTAAATGVGATGFVQFNNFGELGQKNNVRVDYNDVEGNCFWKKDWLPAMLILKNGKAVKLKYVKLNFFSNEVHYLDNTGKELIAQTKISKLIFVEPSDSLKASGVFQFEPGFKINKPDFFVQVLNEGELRLLKRVEVAIAKRDNGPMINNNLDLKFRSEDFYYLGKEENLIPVKLNKKSIASLITIDTQDETWLTKLHNKLKGEKDVLAFLDYYNLRQNQQK